jgi:nucleotide-binding universal stress UspA family protein
VTDSGTGPRRILVPVDFSPASAHSLAFALALGDVFASTVDVLHVWRTNTETPVNVARERARTELRSFVGSLGPLGNATLRRCTDYGDPFLTILRIAQLSSYDLLVTPAPRTGSSGYEGLGLALLEAARLPVLLVPSAWVEGRHDPDLKRRVRKILLPAAYADGARQPRGARSSSRWPSTPPSSWCSRTTSASGRTRRAARRRSRLTNAWPSAPSNGAGRGARGRAQAPREEGGYDLIVLAGARGAVDQSTADPMLARLLAFQRCPPCASAGTEPARGRRELRPNRLGHRVRQPTECSERGGGGSAIAGSLIRILGQTLAHERDQRRRRAPAAPREQRRLLPHLGDDGGCTIARKSGQSYDAFEQHAAEREHVHARTELRRAEHLLGRHVGPGPALERDVSAQARARLAARDAENRSR